MFCRSLFVLLYFFFWPLCCLFFFDIRILIAPLVSSSSSYSYACFVDRCLSFCTFSFGHCFVCSSSICGFWLPIWYLQSHLTAWSLVDSATTKLKEQKRTFHNVHNKALKCVTKCNSKISQINMDENQTLEIDRSWTRKGPGSVYDKWNISVVICDTDIP
jgi:hypothetical protein